MDERDTVTYWQTYAMDNEDDPEWFTACTMMAQAIAAERQAIAAERQASALERIAAVLERADNLSKMFDEKP